MKKFCDILDKYVVLKLPLHQYKCTNRTLESDYQIVGSELREEIRKDEKRLLSLYFRCWQAPYYGNLKGWRTDSPIYILYQGKLVSGIYICDQDEFNKLENWGQLHYFFTDPMFKRRGLHSVLVKYAIDKAKSWNLQGLFINTDRYLLPDVYMRWGAFVCYEIKKEKKKRLLSIIKRVLYKMKKIMIMILTMVLLCGFGCTILNRDFDKYGKNYKKIPLQRISIGDNKKKVKEKLGEPVNVIGSKQFEEGFIEVWAYEKWDARMGWDVLAQEYWLYFLDDELAQWGRPGDWLKEADRIYEFRVR